MGAQAHDRLDNQYQGQHHHGSATRNPDHQHGHQVLTQVIAHQQAEQGHGGQEQGREQQIADQTSDGVIADLIAHVERYARILGRLQQQLVVTEHGHISRAPVVEVDGGQSLARHELQLFYLACFEIT